MKPCFSTFYSRLPGGYRFNDLVKCASAYLKHPQTFPGFIFLFSLRHFILGGGHGIIIPQGNTVIPDFLYHVTLESSLENISKDGIVPASDVVFLTDSIQDLKDYLEWKQFSPENSDRIFLLTVDTNLCREHGINIYKITRRREFIAQSVPPEAIVACENFQERLASNRHDN